MRGPAPKPTAVKVLTGNPGKRPLPEDEPRPDLGATAPPWILASPVLAAEWTRHATRLTDLGILTVMDADALAVLCVASVKFRDQVANDAPADALMATSRELRQLWARFGMTPADRSRVKVAKAAPASKLSRFRGGRPAA